MSSWLWKDSPPWNMWRTNITVVFSTNGVMFKKTLASFVQPCCLCADALVLIHHRQVHVCDGYLSGHLHFQLHAREHKVILGNSQEQNVWLNSNSNLDQGEKKKDPQSYLNMVGNQTAIPSHCDGKVVIATGWLAGHEIQLKNATKNQKKDRSDWKDYLQ